MPASTGMPDKGPTQKRSLDKWTNRYTVTDHRRCLKSLFRKKLSSGLCYKSICLRMPMNKPDLAQHITQ
ncbi:hypothetical protein, partial [Acidithiobacillus ferridurans]|uniref:hypothetical protein n=1 Tax=Acidithiobacillus ferridurans TaxID=1232575 RepID=UPI001C06F358